VHNRIPTAATRHYCAVALQHTKLSQPHAKTIYVHTRAPPTTLTRSYASPVTLRRAALTWVTWPWPFADRKRGHSLVSAQRMAALCLLIFMTLISTFTFQCGSALCGVSGYGDNAMKVRKVMLLLWLMLLSHHWWGNLYVSLLLSYR